MDKMNFTNKGRVFRMKISFRHFFTTDKMILAFLGGIFTLISLCSIFLFSLDGDTDIGVYLFICVFLLIGIVALSIAFAIPISRMIKMRSYVENGSHFLAKVYGYTDDTSIVVNGSFLINIIVHYFDKNSVEREVILETKLDSSKLPPIGYTIDIWEYNGKYAFDIESCRMEQIKGEEELMDDKPIAPADLHYVSMTCMGCGASYKAVAGYSNKCPFCGKYTDA